MKIMEDVYRKRVEFLKRNIGEPDLVVVPMAKRYELLGESLDVSRLTITGAENLHLYGMQVIFVDQRGVDKVLVAMTSAALNKEQP